MNGIPIISTRNREVWTYENKRRLDRLAEMLNSAQVKLGLTCGNPICPSPDIELVRDDTDPGGRILRCGCKDRHFQPRITH
jgi:hypothetical protein